MQLNAPLEAPPLSFPQRLERVYYQRWFLLLLLSMLIIGAIRVLQVNSTDNAFQSRASWNVYAHHRFPFDDPAEQIKRSYYHPVHTAFLTAPFLMFGQHLAAFFNVFIIMMLLIGDRVGWAALATFAFVLSPPLIYVFAAVNMPGVTTALGLIFLLARKRGAIRGYAWAMMACRPQDNAATLIWDAIGALRGRDWSAFLFAAGLMLPTLVTLSDWLSILPTDESQLAIQPGDFYTLSLPINIGVIPALLIVGGIILWRFLIVQGRRVRVRALESITLTERVWLIYVVWSLLQPYFLAYVLWVMLLPVRLYGAGRTLIAFVLIFMLGAFTLNTLELDSAWFGALLITLVMALLTPKTKPPIMDRGSEATALS